MEYFVHKNSAVRKIWSKGDTILFIFAGAAAEFALNKAVDWLYFTGRLPSDPLGRLFSTVSYARKIVFSNSEDALKAIDKITSIHSAVENDRGAKIPDWAYRDVLYMLIHYSISSYELMETCLSDADKADVYDVFYRMGTRMNLKDLPITYTDWKIDRDAHMYHDLKKSDLTVDLFKQYKKHLGSFRYFILIEGQKLVIPEIVRNLLGFTKVSAATPLIGLYKFVRIFNAHNIIKSIILPAAYKSEIADLDVPYHS